MIQFLRTVKHLFFKSLSYFIFGVGGILFAVTVGPPALLAVRKEGRSNDFLRALVSFAFRIFFRFMKLVGLVSYEVVGLEKLQNEKSLVICANHPTLLDAVFLIGLTPKADCLVKASHWRNPFTMPVVSRLYIPNSLSGVETVERSGESLSRGHNLILFPEGTRTDFQSDRIQFTRGAAQIALRNKRDILPVRIELNSSKGLGKHDSFFYCPDNFRFKYKLIFLDPIPVSEYSDLPIPKAARILTEDIKVAIFHLWKK